MFAKLLSLFSENIDFLNNSLVLAWLYNTVNRTCSKSFWNCKFSQTGSNIVPPTPDQIL